MQTPEQIFKNYRSMAFEFAQSDCIFKIHIKIANQIRCNFVNERENPILLNLWHSKFVYKNLEVETIDFVTSICSHYVIHDWLNSLKFYLAVRKQRNDFQVNRSVTRLLCKKIARLHKFEHFIILSKHRSGEIKRCDCFSCEFQFRCDDAVSWISAHFQNDTNVSKVCHIHLYLPLP